MVFGIYPASRAARLAPIDALRRVTRAARTEPIERTTHEHPSDRLAGRPRRARCCWPRRCCWPARCWPPARARKAAGRTRPPRPPPAPAAGPAPARRRRPGRVRHAGRDRRHTLQVQNQSTGQVSVSYSATTTFSQTRRSPSTALQGRRLRDRDRPAQPAERLRPAPPAPSPSSRPTSFPAASVQISAPVQRQLHRRRVRRRDRQLVARRPSGRPSGFPAARPAAARRPAQRRPAGHGGGFGFGDFATGTVSALSAGSMTVQTLARGQQAGQHRHVTLSASTSYTETVHGHRRGARRSANACRPPARPDTTGAVAASRIALSPAGGRTAAASAGSAAGRSQRVADRGLRWRRGRIVRRSAAPAGCSPSRCWWSAGRGRADRRPGGGRRLRPALPAGHRDDRLGRRRR